MDNRLYFAWTIALMALAAGARATPVNVTSQGSVSASSTYQNNPTYSPSKAVDGSTGSNWFSDGCGGGRAAAAFSAKAFIGQVHKALNSQEWNWIPNRLAALVSVQSSFGFTTVQEALFSHLQNFRFCHPSKLAEHIFSMQAPSVRSWK
jgi:hypothetical protein